MGSYEQAMDVGKILLHALGELKSIRGTLHGDEGRDIDGNVALDEALAKAEHSLREKAEQLSEVILREEAAHEASVAPTSFKPQRVTARERFLAKQAFDPRQKMILDNPTSREAREFIAEKYGVEAPLPQGNARSQGINSNEGNLAKGLATVKAGTVLPRLARTDPYYVHNALSERDVEQGVFNLLNRGLLPRVTDVTTTLSGAGQVLSTQKVDLKDPRERDGCSLGGPATLGTGYDLSNVKLDLLTPVEPQQRSSTGAFAGPSEGIAKAAPYASRINVGVPADSPHMELGSEEEIARMEQMLAQEMMHGGAPQPLKPKRSPGPSPLGRSGGLGSLQTTPTPTHGIEQDDHSGDHERDARSDTAEAEPNRGYEALLDQFSLHEFLIRRGATLDMTPEFESYKRAFQPVWHLVGELIIRLEETCRRYIVPLAVIDGKALAELAIKLNGADVTTEAVLGCIKNLESVVKLMRQPGRQFMGPNGKTEAAVCIQKHIRGHLTRRRALYGDLVMKAVIPIQRAWRLYLNYCRTKELVEQRLADTRHQFAQLQAKFVREWREIQQGPRVIVHIASCSLDDADQRMSMHNFRVRQNSQLSRLCDLADPNVEVVLVVPFRLPEDILGYYAKLLAVGGVTSPEKRHRVVVPEYAPVFSEHLSLTRLLYYSSYALKRIQAITKGRPAYIVPGLVGEEEMKVAVRLGLPMLGAHPEMALSLGRKSIARSIFMEAEVNVAPGAELPPGGRFSAHNPLVIHYEEQAVDPDAREGLLTTLASLMVEQPTVPRWLMKIDDEHGGRGHAWVDVANIKGLAAVLERLTDGGKASGGDGVEPPSLARQREAAPTVEATLRRSLARRVAIAVPALFPNWEAYAAQLLERGGVIEASPALVTGSPSVNLLIEPTGYVTVLSTHEQIFCPAYRFIGASFPQSSVPHAALAQAAEVVGLACFRSGIIGHIGVDFLALREQGALRLWAVDLNLQLTATQASFQMFDFVCKGAFDEQVGAYMVDVHPVVEGDDGDEGVMRAGGTPAVIQQRRFYVMNNYISHSGLAALQYTAFFNRCRLDGVCFDMAERCGTAFNLMDSFASGVLGILCVGHTPQEAFRELAGALSFIGKHVGQEEDRDREAGGVEHTFRAVHTTIKYLADKLNASAAVMIAQAQREMTAE